MRHPPGKSVVQRWPLGAAAPTSPPRFVSGSTTTLALVGALALLAPGPLVVRALIALALFVTALAIRRMTAPRPRVCGWVVADSTGLHRTDGAGSSRIARWDEPFGV